MDDSAIIISVSIFGVLIAIMLIYVVQSLLKDERTTTRIPLPPKREQNNLLPDMPEDVKEMIRKCQIQNSKKRELSDEEKVKRIFDADTKDFSNCCRVSQHCMTLIVTALKDIQGGISIINKIGADLDSYKKEFTILIVAFNNLFSDKNGRGYYSQSDKYSFHNGAYRLCRILKMATSDTPNVNISNEDVDKIEERIEFYKKEINYINTAQFGIPIYLLYSLFNPLEEINPANSLTDLDLFECIFLWGIIKGAIKI